MVAEANTERVALFGGSFNPPHMGHILGVVHALSTGQVDRVLVVPVFEHALSKKLLPFAERLDLAIAAFQWLPGVEVSDIERQLGAPSRTLDTLKALNERHPNWQMRLLIGSDILGEMHRWHAFEEIEKRAPLLVLGRAGDPHGASLHCGLPEVSSTEVRRLLETRPSKTELGDSQERLSQLVPARVLELIVQRRLY